MIPCVGTPLGNAQAGEQQETPPTTTTYSTPGNYTLQLPAVYSELIIGVRGAGGGGGSGYYGGSSNGGNGGNSRCVLDTVFDLIGEGGRGGSGPAAMFRDGYTGANGAASGGDENISGGGASGGAGGSSFYGNGGKGGNGGRSLKSWSTSYVPGSLDWVSGDYDAGAHQEISFADSAVFLVDQIFKAPNNGYVNGVSVWLSKVGNPNDSIYCQLCAVNAQNRPITGLGAGSVSDSLLTTTPQRFDITLSPPTYVEAGTNYAIRLIRFFSRTDAANYYKVSASTASLVPDSQVDTEKTDYTFTDYPNADLFMTVSIIRPDLAPPGGSTISIVVGAGGYGGPGTYPGTAGSNGQVTVTTTQYQ